MDISALHGREFNVEQAVIEERFKTLRDVLCTLNVKGKFNTAWNTRTGSTYPSDPHHTSKPTRTNNDIQTEDRALQTRCTSL